MFFIDLDDFHRSDYLSCMLTPEQCRAARALLDWTQTDLADRTGIAVSTVRGFESGRHTLMRSNMAMLQATLEQAGVVFIAADVMGPGVRLRTPKPSTVR